MRSSEKGKARRKRSKRTKAVRKPKPVTFKGLPYERINYLLIGLGIALVVLGFVFLYFGESVISTILLVVGYVIVLPIALIWVPKKKKIAPEEPSPSTADPGVEPETSS